MEEVKAMVKASKGGGQEAKALDEERFTKHRGTAERSGARCRSYTIEVAR